MDSFSSALAAVPTETRRISFHHLKFDETQDRCVVRINRTLTDAQQHKQWHIMVSRRKLVCGVIAQAAIATPIVAFQNTYANCLFSALFDSAESKPLEKQNGSLPTSALLEASPPVANVRPPPPPPPPTWRASLASQLRRLRLDHASRRQAGLGRTPTAKAEALNRGRPCGQWGLSPG